MEKTIVLVVFVGFVCAQASNITVDLHNPIGWTGPMFIGVTMDTSFLSDARFSRLNLNSKSLYSLARALSPCYLRVGGTMADSLVFNAPAPPGNLSLTPERWQQVNQLVQAAHWDLIFDFNVHIRHGNTWDPSNARSLLRYSSGHGYKIACFQLGNEPNWFPKKFQTSMNPQRLAHDYQLLRSLLHEFPQYRNSCIVGPEVTKLSNVHTRQYFDQFMQAEQRHPVLDAVGLHHYYANFKYRPTPAYMSNLTSIPLMNTLNEELQLANSVTHRHAPGLPVWLTETSSAVGNDAIIDSYGAGFMWLDKLGLSAQYGISHVIRQSFVFHLMNIHHRPTPGYYVTLLHKRLIQGPVLKVVSGSTNHVRVYAHCANTDNNLPGAITLFILNLQPHSVTLTFNQFKGQQLQLYMLTPGDEHSLSSHAVALNGKRLVMTENEELPDLSPQTTTGTVTMAAETFGFAVIPHANVSACQQH